MAARQPVPSGNGRNGHDTSFRTPGGTKLSFPQQRLWFLDRLEPGAPIYNIVHAIRLFGKLDVTALQRSLNQIIRRHDILRTTFHSDSDGPVQVVTPHRDLTLAVRDLQSTAATNRNAEIAKLTNDEARQPFNLETGPMFRAKLLKLAPEQHTLLLAFHHIVFDNWSEKVLAQELAAHYSAFLEERPSRLAEIAMQYADYARGQRAKIQGPTIEKAVAYWKEKLKTASDGLTLPTDRPEPHARTLRGGVVSETLSAELSSGLQRLSRESNATLFTITLAAFETLLARYSGQENVIVGVPTTDRPQETEQLIGFFVNTLPVRGDLSGNPTFSEFLRRVRDTVSEAFAHEDAPFEKLVEVLRPERALSRNPLFRVMFVYQDAPLQKLELPGLRVEAEEFFSATAKFDLTLFVTETESGFHLRFEYSTDVFDEATVHRTLRHYRRLLESVVARPESRLSELELLESGERHQLLESWNQTSTDYPQELCVHQLVEAQVERTPDEVAAVFGPEQLTYRELDTQAAQFATKLRGLGVGPDTRVGLCVERSLDMLVGVLGILKAGGCYVPLDPNYPAERLAYMLEDSKAPVVLTQKKLVPQLSQTKATVVCLDEPLAESQTQFAPVAVTPDNLAYVIYTSGSTGKPKGVAMPHRPLVNLIWWQLQNSQAGRGSRTAQFTSLSFDVSFQEIFSTWSCGGTLVVVAQSVRRDPHALWKLLADARVERLFLPFVALQQMAEVASESENVPRQLREVITAGEQLQATKKIIAMFERIPGCTLHNHYGPTESHVCTAYTLRGVARMWPTLPPIGRPINNTRIYILDSHGQHAPIGVPGELFIGGLCLAREYLNKPEMTQERFLPDPFRSDESRIYKTGDLARYLPDGNIEFLGRMDHQVKIRGFRVELGEIEDALRRHGHVRDSAVVAREVTPGDKRLLAYYTVRDSVTPSQTELREFLRGSLPEYMLPATYVAVEKFPLTPSGKVDRKALAEIGDHPIADAEKPAPPRTPIEQTLVSIWCDVLNRTDVGIHDNFFAIGGHSLLAIQVIDRVNKAGLGLSLNQVFQYQTIAELANVAGTNQTVEAGSEEWFSLVTLQPKGKKPPFYLIHTAPGDLLGYMKLVYYMGRDQPCYGFQSYGLLRQGASHESLQDMAAHYVRLLREFQPEGPYYLGGWCFGGNVAAEMAWQLVDQGQEVAAVIVVEGWAHRPPYRFWKYYVHRVYSLLKRGPHGVARRYIGKFSRFFGRGDEAQERKAEFAFETARTGPLVNREHVYQVNLRATEKYLSRPSVYPGCVTLFIREDFGNGDIIGLDCGFATLARETKTYLIPGDHVSVLKEPHVKHLAQKLKECLAEARAEPSKYARARR